MIASEGVRRKKKTEAKDSSTSSETEPPQVSPYSLVARLSQSAEKLTHWFLFAGVAVGEVGVDWGLAKVRRPRLRRPGSDALTNVSSAEDSLGREV